MFVTFPIVRGWGICVWTCTEKIWEDVKRSSTSKLEVCYTSPVRPSVCQRLCAQLAHVCYIHLREGNLWELEYIQTWSSENGNLSDLQSPDKNFNHTMATQKKRNHDCPRHVRQQELTSSCYHKVIWSNLITCFPNPSTLAGGSWRGLGF